MIEWIGLGALLAFIVGATWFFVRRRRLMEERDEALLAEAKKTRKDIPPTLHPVIDPDICIGSFSCLTVCPEGDILGAVNGRAELINAAACIGHGKCALECPVNAISLVFGTSQRGVELPEVSEHFETNRKGVFIVGELGGMGLIKNAINQGLQCATHLGGAPVRGKAGADAVDVAIVGAGPAGIATAIGLRQAGKSCRLLEQGSIGGTIFHYPRQKIVMTERVDLPLFGKFGANLISKEELLASLQKAVNKAGLKVEQGVKVGAIKGEDGAFTLDTNLGPVLARKVVLAVGRAGTPRKLGVPGEELPKVAYRLSHPEQYDGCKLLVVGGGDSALEAAMQVADETDAEVTLSYRSADLSRCRDANKKKFAEMVAKGAIKKLMPSQVKKVSAKSVSMDVEGKPLELANDYLIVAIGGEPPAEFLKAAGIEMQRHWATGRAGEEPDARRRGSAKDQAEDKRLRRLSIGLFALGAFTIAILTAIGWDYYWLPKEARIDHHWHKLLKSSGAWGHGVGIVATVVMMSNFLYAVRKRWDRLKGYGSIKGWMTFHQFVGFMSPMVIVFHAAFQWNNWVATLTNISLVVVVLTGIIGRFFYGLVPTSDGRTEEHATVVARWERLKSRVDPLLGGVKDPSAVRMLLDKATAAPEKGNVVSLLWKVPLHSLENRRQLSSVAALFPDREHFLDFSAAFENLEKLRTQVGFYRSLKRFMGTWRVLHVVLAIALVFVITAHIGLSLYLGYKWIFT